MSTAVQKLIELLEVEKSLMIEYLKQKLANSDWHGVQDAASDIREIEAKLNVLKRKQ